MSAGQKTTKRLVKTITKVPLHGGGFTRLNWTETALLAAELLDQIPVDPPPLSDQTKNNPEPNQPVGLLGNAIALLSDRKHWESRYPNRDKAIEGLQIIEKHLEGYAMTGTVWHDQADGKCLLEAWANLSVIVKDGWAMPAQRRTLPVLIASIARTASVEASMKAKTPRKRQHNALRLAKHKTQRLHPGLSVAEILNRMEGPEGVVIRWDAATIEWTDGTNNFKTPTKTFQNWKSPI